MKKGLLGISLITLGCLWGLVAAIFIAFSIIIGYPVYISILISFIVIFIQFLVAPFFTDLTMRWFYGAKFGYQMPEYFNTFVNDICKKYNMKAPKIGYIDDGAPNAFTYGRTKNDARIIVTRGIFELLTPEEVKSVVGHELGHVVHYDMAFMTVAQLVPLVLYFVYEVCTDNNNNNNKSSKNSGGAYLSAIGLVAYVLYLISQYIILWLSRTREYAADEFSLEETKNPSALAEALVKIGFGLSTSKGQNVVDGKTKRSASKSNALGIFDSKTSKALAVSSSDANGVNKSNIKNAMKWEMWNVWSFFYELQSTHPLISKRLLAISKRCPEFNQEPYIVFDLQKPESYVDDFVGELLLREAPIFISFVSFIIWVILDAIEFDSQITLVVLFGGLTIASLISIFKLGRRYKNKNYNATTVSNLLGEVKVSDVTAIPCIVTGKIIGRGNPGCVFNEDFIVKDSTGIIFLDYNQPIRIVNKIFALFKSPEYFDKDVVIKGWYRRSPVPYIEINTMTIDGKVKKCHTYAFSKFGHWFIFITLLIVTIFFAFGV